MQVHRLWIPCVMELLQLELDDWANTDEKCRSLCMACIRKLSRAFNVLPPSLFLVNIQREHPHPIRGGGFADIWKGKIGEQAICLKVLCTYLESDESTRKKVGSDFCNEALLWRQLRHPNILPFFGVNTTLFGFCLVSPWMSNGDIVTYLKNHPDHGRRSVIMEIADGLNYLHSLKPPVVHGDVRGANILMNDDGHCCLADFGLAIASESTGLLTTTGHGTRGAIRWMAPELIHTGEQAKKPLSRDQRPRDVYAFACTVVEILSCNVPFSEKPTDIAVMFAIVNGLRPGRPEGVWCPDDIWSLIKLCWSQKPGDRVSANYIWSTLLNEVANGTIESDTHEHLTRETSSHPWRKGRREGSRLKGVFKSFRSAKV
ncbi:kinase-like domain-containing protein [Rhodocollybia butyracea]|uniref:Kinase-like domain-containing protein n=1 Tax=Rhodocollybia butyracea TaxID=206335 RepID=A0A9P5PH51_9AGAR|nr:kinase-like domain-containing protein [Rhodocollybia butyracea]